MNDVMLQFGNFQFRAPEAAYQQLTRVTPYKWVAIPRLGNTPVRQFVGKDDKATLTGYILPQIGGGLESMSRLRIMADQKKPWLLVDGLDRIHGFWCIESITEKRSIFTAGGLPKRIDFTVQISYFGKRA